MSAETPPEEGAGLVHSREVPLPLTRDEIESPLTNMGMGSHRPKAGGQGIHRLLADGKGSYGALRITRNFRGTGIEIKAQSGLTHPALVASPTLSFENRTDRTGYANR